MQIFMCGGVRIKYTHKMQTVLATAQSLHSLTFECDCSSLSLHFNISLLSSEIEEGDPRVLRRAVAALRRLEPVAGAGGARRGAPAVRARPLVGGEALLHGCAVGGEA